MKTTYDYGEENQLNLKLVIGLSRSALNLDRNTQRLVSEYGLTLPQFGVLEVLYHLGALRICDIIEKTLSTSGNMTVVIRNLELEGLVNRYQDPEDKRVFRIEITERGQAIIAELFPRHIGDLAKLMERLQPEEKEEMVRLMKKMNGIE